MEESEELVNDMLRELATVIRTMPKPADEAEPFGQWPRERMNVMYRYLAGEADLPKNCSDRRCRRRGYCHGGLGREDCQACAAGWSEADLGKLRAACLALVLGWMDDTCHLHDLADMILVGEA